MSDSPASDLNTGAPPNYPHEYVESVTLRDGTPLVIRPIRPDDAPRLQAAFSRLSPESIYLRFLQPYRELSDQQAQRFANVDYQEHMALVATLQHDGQEAVIGVARYGMIGPERPGLAESAIVVGDAFQNRGLGTLLVSRLVQYAIAHGVTGFLATVHAQNAKIMHFIRRSGLPFQRKIIEPGVWEILIQLDNLASTQSGQDLQII